MSPSDVVFNFLGSCIVADGLAESMLLLSWILETTLLELFLLD